MLLELRYNKNVTDNKLKKNCFHEIGNILALYYKNVQNFHIQYLRICCKNSDILFQTHCKDAIK